jgi:mono/diheme cytochrome c family protein
MALWVLLLVLLLALIFAYRQNRTTPCRRGVSVLMAAVLVGLAAGLVLSPATNAESAAPGKSGPGTTEASALYRRYCQTCHGADGKGDGGGAGSGVPDFTQGAWQRQRTDPQLAVTIREGKGTGMPAFNDRLGEAQVKTLVAHLRAFGPERPGKTATASPAAAAVPDFDAQFQQLQKELEELKRQMKELDSTPPRRETTRVRAAAARVADNGPKGAAREVGALYRRYCLRCHGADGKGDPEANAGGDLPDFSRRAWQERQTDAQLLASILDGKKEGMPAFRSKMSEAEAKALVTHVRAFAPKKPADATGKPGTTSPTR